MGKRLSVKFILPSLTENESAFWRPIKYSLFPPLGLATLAAYLQPDDDAQIVDQHVEPLDVNDQPDLVVIQVYITNAYRAYKIADHYRKQGVFVALGGLHVTALPDEAAQHADSIFLGPGEETFPLFLAQFRRGEAQRRYHSSKRSLENLPPIRRDLLKRNLYLVPNSLVVSRGCPHHCDFCYKDSFFEGGKSFYTQRVDQALSEIEKLPGKHLYFLDDHLLADKRFSRDLFGAMQGMGRLFQGAATVRSIVRGDLIERAAEAGLRSVFIGFESINSATVAQCNKPHNQRSEYEEAISRLHDLGIMINGSFVFGLDQDDRDVFKRTVHWAVDQGITTSTFHIATPYPGTAFHQQMKDAGRITNSDWGDYDTRHAVFKPKQMTQQELEQGYEWSYKAFYRWQAIYDASRKHPILRDTIRHFGYASAWKKFEPLWNFVITNRVLSGMRPLLERLLTTQTPSDPWAQQHSKPMQSTAGVKQS